MEESKQTSQNEFLAVIFVTSGTRGDRLLFKYPYEEECLNSVSSKSHRKNPYSVTIIEDLKFRNKKEAIQNIASKRGCLAGLSDASIANLLGVKSSLLCGQNFDVKVDENRFVGFPLLLDDIPDKTTVTGKTAHKILSFNIVFVIKAHVGPSVVACYQDLAKQVTVALKHEERRCQYLSTQAKIMTSVHDEIASLPEDAIESSFENILQKSQLAQHLCQIYNSLGEHGEIHLYINNWISLNFCLPHKLHFVQVGNKSLTMDPDAIQKHLKYLRPYHGILLLQDENTLLESLPLDATPALSRLIQVANPLRSLQTLALEADLSLFQVFQLVCHLVFWAKATIIYPLCETNVYILSPHADTQVSSLLVEDFVRQFPGRSLPVELAEFSFPTQLRESQNVLQQQEKQDLKIRMVVWMLQHHLLVQLHTYVFFVPPVPRRRKKVSEEWIVDNNLQRSPSFSDGASETATPIEVKFHVEPPWDGGMKVRSNGLCLMTKPLNILTGTKRPMTLKLVTSEESFTLSTPGMLVAQLSKSPSSEFTADSNQVNSEENKAHWLMQEAVFGHLSTEEKECITNVPAAKNLDDLRMFVRLFPYFSGNHHIEEIMYFENLRRSQLLMLLDKFRNVLILCNYEDPATTFCGSVR